MKVQVEQLSSIDSDSLEAKQRSTKSITTPDQVETGFGTLEFKDGYPTAQTVEKIREELDYLHGVEAFMNGLSTSSTSVFSRSTL